MGRGKGGGDGVGGGEGEVEEVEEGGVVVVGEELEGDMVVGEVGGGFE